MDTAAAPGPAPVPPLPGVSSRATPEAELHESSFMEPIERTFATLRRLATNYALLGVLDMRRAAIQFAWLISAGIMITVLVVTAWLAGVVALAVWMFGQGMSWPAVLSTAALLNLAAAAFVAWKVKHIFDQKPFSATLRQLKAEPTAQEKQ
jgi:uncharacterized membrane protein YqjE